MIMRSARSTVGLTKKIRGGGEVEVEVGFQGRVKRKTRKVVFSRVQVGSSMEGRVVMWAPP